MNSRKGYLYLASSIITASLMYIMTRLIISSVNVYSVMSIYFSAAFSFGVLSSKIFIKTDLINELKNHALLILVVSALTIIGAYFWFLSIGRAGAAATSLLAKLQTIFTVAAGVILLKEKFVKSAWIAVAGTVVGGVLIVYKGGRIDFLDAFWMSIFSASYALQSYLVRKYASSIDMIAFTVWRSFFIAFFFIILAQAKGNLVLPQMGDFAILSVAGILGAYLSKGLQYMSFRYLPISTVSVLTNTESILTLILAAAFLREQFSLINIFGASLVIAGSASLIYIKTVRKKLIGNGLL